MIEPTQNTVSNTPLVSVIVPVYKVEQYLGACIRSLLEQDYANYEIILVDDGSPDRCGEMCEGWALRDSRIKVVHKANAGLGIARNSGLEVAQGEWVVFVDSDDIVSHQLLGCTVRCALSTGADQVRFLFDRFHQNDESVTSTFDEAAQVEATVIDGFPGCMDPMLPTIGCIESRLSRPMANASACCGLYRMSIIRDHGLRFHSERELVSEDFVFNLEYGRYCKSIAYMEATYYHYRYNPQSLSTSFRPGRIDDIARFNAFLGDALDRWGYEDGQFLADANAVGGLRMHLRHLFAAGLDRDKRKSLFHEAVRHKCFEQVASRGLWRRLPLGQRLAFAMRKSYPFSLFALRAREIIRR